MTLRHKILALTFDVVLRAKCGEQSNLDYSKCQGPQKSFRIMGSSNDRNREFSDIFGKAWMLS